MPQLVKKTIIIVFTLDLHMHAFFQMRITFWVPFHTLPFGLGVIVKHPWFISSYYFIQKIWLNFKFSGKSWQISNWFAFCSTDKFFGTRFAQIFRMCKWSVRILWTAFLSKPVSSSIILTLNRQSFVITARTTSTFWSFVDETCLPERGSSSTFPQPTLKALCHLKTIVLDRLAPP